MTAKKHIFYKLNLKDLSF